MAWVSKTLVRRGKEGVVERGCDHIVSSVRFKHPTSPRQKGVRATHSRHSGLTPLRAGRLGTVRWRTPYFTEAKLGRWRGVWNTLGDRGVYNADRVIQEAQTPYFTEANWGSCYALTALGAYAPSCGSPCYDVASNTLLHRGKTAYWATP